MDPSWVFGWSHFPEVFTAALGFNQTVSSFATAEVTWAIYYTLRIIGPSKLAIFRTLSLLYRFVHPSIGGSFRSLRVNPEPEFIRPVLGRHFPY